MDCLSPSNPTEKVVFMKGAQIGGTEAGNNWVGSIIDQAPGPMLVVQPTVEMGKRWSKGRLAPLLEDTPCLKGKVKDPRSRDSGNTVQSKEFRGGIVVVTGANSAVGLRSMPVRYLFLNEVDAYPGDADGEGDPVSLAIQRTATFARRKILLVSTPTIQGASRIEMEYVCQTGATPIRSWDRSSYAIEPATDVPATRRTRQIGCRMNGLSQLFRDTFACLSLTAELIQEGKARPVRLLIRHPESWIALGDGEVLSARIIGEILIAEVPQIFMGDSLYIGGRTVRIFQEPLKDPSGTVWQVHGALVEGAL